MLLSAGFLVVIQPAARAAEGTEIATVSSRVSDDYARTKLPNGSFEPETYTFGEGGHWSGAMSDDTIDKLHFIDVARVVAGPLAAQNFLPGKDPKQIKLLIMVYWGTTIGAGGASSTPGYQALSAANQTLSNANLAALAAGLASGPGPGSPGGGSGGMSGSQKAAAFAVKEAAQAEFDSAMAVAAMENRKRDKINQRNAGILGYDTEFALTPGMEFTALRFRRQDLIDELEEDRYFVVLMAYDFQIMWKEKKHKLLWETRFSIRQRHNSFDKQVAAMVENASRYFGQDSHGLIRKPLPEGRVTLGDATVLGVEPERK